LAAVAPTRACASPTSGVATQATTAAPRATRMIAATVRPRRCPT